MRTKHLPRSRINFLGLFVFLAFIIFGFFGVFQLLPILSGNRVGKTDRFNVVVSGTKTLLLSFNIAQKSAVVLSFPDDLYMSEVAFGYGQYRLSSVFGVGQLDKRGGQTLSQTLQEYVGIPVDGFVRLGGSTGSLKQIILSKDFLSAKSNLSFPEKLQLMVAVFKLRDDKIKSLDLSKLTSPLVLADGSVAVSLEKDELDNFFSGVFFEDGLRDEDFRVEVVNTTKITGLGSRVSRLLSNIGMTVVNVDTSGELLSQCRIEANEKVTNSKTVGRIVQIYGCQINKTDQNIRASSRVLVGMDYAKKVSP